MMIGSVHGIGIAIRNDLMPSDSMTSNTTSNAAFKGFLMSAASYGIAKP